MTDIVERLRIRADDTFIRDHPLMAEAADEIERMRALVKDLADDLEAELNGRYPQNIRDYPSMDARYERDMANVYEARRALGRNLSDVAPDVAPVSDPKIKT